MVDTSAEKMIGAENVIWDLSVFYEDIDDPAIDADMKRVDELVDHFVATYRGEIAELGAEEFVTLYQKLEEIYDLAYRIGSYIQLAFSTDTANPGLGALLQKVTEHDAQISQKLVFVELEWNALDDETARQILDNPVLGKYRYHMEAERRFKPYQLSEVEEQLLIETGVTGRNAWGRFFTQLTSSMRYELDGAQLNFSQVSAKLHDRDREIRRKGADALTAGLKKRLMELTYIFNVLAADKAFSDRRRGYETWISSRNLSNKAPDAVVDALIDAVTSSYDLVARHYHIKRVLLGYDELYDYDRYAPLPLKEGEETYSWQEARQIVLDAYHAFSPRMGEVAAKFFDGNWIHAPVLPNKRGGAYASPTVPSAHPFVFVNYMGTARDIMTLAHELGHGAHMYLSAKAQGLFGLYTPLTTAEMASVFGEMLVFQDLMAKERDKETQLMMLSQKIEDTFATVFRQVSMNRFEHGMHTARRAEGELSSERLSAIWMVTQKAMFQDSVTMREDYGVWWSYVPHFLHTPGYVYAYAFGELLVLALYRLYEEQGADFVPKYLDLLAAGDSDYPDRLLAKVGVDLNDPAFWNKGIDVIGELLAQEEELARELYSDKFN